MQIQNFQIKRKATKFLGTLLVLFSCFVIGNSTVEAATQFRVFADDTIAGWSTLLRSSIGPANTPIVVDIRKPNGSIVSIEGITNAQGTFELEVLGYHNKEAGEYYVRAKVKGESDSTNYSTYTVYPESVSVSKSSVSVNNLALKADGYDHAVIQVILMDEYGNRIPNHALKVISSRVEDTIEYLTQQSDQSGRFQAKITSELPGFSTLIIQDVTGGDILKERPQITFLKAEENNKALTGNDFLMANLLAQDEESDPLSDEALEELFGDTPDDTGEETLEDLFGAPSSEETADDPFADTSPDMGLHGELDRFEIEILPSIATDGTNVKINENFSLKVQALDAEDRKVTSYTGTIRFSSSDQNATLPEDYEFTTADLGEKIFSLAFKLTALGTQTIEVVDIDDWFKTGKIDLNVAERIDDQASVDSEIEIKYPEDNVTLNQKTITLSGQGPANIGIDIFINGVLTTSSDIDTDGFFSTAIQVEEGLNKVFVIEQNGKERKSNTVNFMVDVTPPSIDTFQVIPEGDIKVGEFYSVILTSEPGLEEVAIRVLVEHPLTESLSEPGKYEATLPAPLIAGEYPIHAILVDELGNRLETNTNRTLHIIDKELPTPPVVTGLQADAGDQKVRLSWNDVSKDSETPIGNYKVYFGTDRNVLSKNKNTSSTETEMLIENLNNDVEYFFAVTAMSEDGYESKEKSLIVSATPSQGQNIDQLGDNQLRGVAGDGKMTLTWDPFPNVQASRYKVYYGLQSGRYTSYIVTDLYQTSLVIGDLANGVTYYAAVSPINANGLELNLRSNEVAVTPTGLGISGPIVTPQIPRGARPGVALRAPIGQVGPESLWIVFFSFAIAQSSIIFRKTYFKSKK